MTLPEHCNSLEGTEEQQDDPRHWSPLRQFVEIRKHVSRRQSVPHEEISEEMVREILARQYGTTPEQVTGTQIRFEVAGLLRQYPVIRLVSSKAASKAQAPRKGPGKAAGENMSEANAPEGAASVGRQIDRYRQECRLTIDALAAGIRVTSRTADRHIADICRPRAEHRAAYERLFSKLLKRKIVIE